MHDFICTLPQGYDTPVGELGDTLSGGERQRLGLARAFLHDAPFLLLDEPTSNLDAEAMERLRNMVKRLKRDGIAIVIAEHRLAWVADLADRYVVFDAGRVVGEYTAEQFHALPNAWSEGRV